MRSCQLLLAFLPFTLFAQGRVDTLIASFVQYHSPSEKDLFERVRDEPTRNDLVALLLEVDLGQHRTATTDALARIEAFTAQHSRYAIGSAMKVKQLERLFKEVQSEFLIRYDVNAFFDELFVNGDFNCLTASILFALIFDDFGLPYQLHIQPEHVYIVTWVDNTPVSVETTDPVSGVFAYDERFKRKYIEELLKAKLVSRTQLDTLGLEATIATLSEADSVVDIRGMAGAQYYNSGVFEYEKGRPDTAIAQYAKSYVLFPFEQTRGQLVLALAAHLDRSDLDTPEEIDLYARAWAIAGIDVKGEALYATYSRLVDRALMERSDTTLAKETTETLLRYIDEPSLRERLLFEHHSEFARYYAIKKQYGPALEHILVANAINPDHVQVSEWVVEILVQKLQRTTDKVAFVAFLDALQAEHPELRDQVGLRRCYMITYLWAAEERFDVDHRIEAEKFLSDFEVLYDPEDASLPVDAIAHSYIAGWRSWSRARRSEKAKECLSRGMRIAPYNEELNRFSRYSTY